MLQFSYEVKDQAGRFAKGTVEAYSEEAAVDALQGKGFIILSLVKAEDNALQSDVLSFLAKPNRKDVVVFTRQLATIISADIPLLEGLETIVVQTEKPSFAKVIKEMADAIRGG